jgi:hypothetical protein
MSAAHAVAIVSCSAYTAAGGKVPICKTKNARSLIFCPREIALSLQSTLTLEVYSLL